jgi:hypothetical protein
MVLVPVGGREESLQKKEERIVTRYEKRFT